MNTTLNMKLTSYIMTTTLNMKNKLEFVYGSLQQSTLNHVFHATWEMSNNMVVSWLIYSLSHFNQTKYIILDQTLYI